MEVFRGDIYMVEKTQTTGCEIQAGRPAVIVSNNMGNHFSSNVEVVYLTTAQKKPLPTHVDVLCKVPSTALCESVFTVSKERLGEFIKTCTDAEMKQIDNALKVSLALDNTTDATDGGAEVEKLKMLLDDAVRKNDMLCDELQAMESNPELLKVQTERDLYKTLYEQMLDKMIGR